MINSCPGKDKLSDLVVGIAIDSLMILRDDLKEGVKVFMTSDKGSKKGNKNLANVISWTDKIERKVKENLIDTNCSDETSE